MNSTQIRTLREQLQLTQELFARILGVSFATVNRWENGKSVPSGDYARVLQTLQQLAATNAPGPPIDWRRVGALSAMAAVAGLSPLLTLGAALAPMLIAHLPSWADVPLGAAVTHSPPELSHVLPPVGKAGPLSPSGALSHPRSLAPSRSQNRAQSRRSTLTPSRKKPA